MCVYVCVGGCARIRVFAWIDIFIKVMYGWYVTRTDYFNCCNYKINSYRFILTIYICVCVCVCVCARAHVLS